MESNNSTQAYADMDQTVFDTTQWLIISAWMAVASLVGFLGNVWVLVTIYKHEQLREPTYFLIANLAIGDILLCFLYMVNIIYLELEQATGSTFGYYYCQWFAMMTQLVAFQTLWTLTFVSFDRKIAICDPLYYHSRMKIGYILIMIVISWVVPLIITIMPFLGFGKYVKDPYIGICQALWVSRTKDLINALYIYLMGLQIFPLIMVVIVNYWKIYREASKVANCHRSTEEERFRLKSRKTAKVTGIVLGIFLITWTPYTAIHMSKMYVDHIPWLSVLEMLSIVFFQSSSYINPFVYGIMNRRMRKYMFKLIGKKMSS